MGVSRFLGYLVGDTKVSRKFGMGVSKILGYLVGGTRIPYSHAQGGAEYPRIYGMGVPNFLGCQIYCDTGPSGLLKCIETLDSVSNYYNSYAISL